MWQLEKRKPQFVSKVANLMQTLLSICACDSILQHRCPSCSDGRLRARVPLAFFNLTHRNHGTSVLLSHAVFEVGEHAWWWMEASIAPSSSCGWLCHLIDRGRGGSWDELHET